MNLRQIEAFIWIANLGSFRKTAERLFTTQPAISSRISNLEDSLGVKLFERDTGSVRLTAAGLELLPYAERIMRTAETMRERAGDPTRFSGLLRIGVSETIVHAWLPTYIKRLYSLYPGLDVEITVDVTINLRTELIARSIDLAFLMGPISEYTVANSALCDFPLTWIASPSLGIDPKTPLDGNALAANTILTYARNTRPYAEIQRYFHDVGTEPVRVFPSSSLSACIRMAQDGMGIASLPAALVESHLSNGSLIALNAEWTPSSLHFTTSYAFEPNRPILEKAAALAREIANEDSARRAQGLRPASPTPADAPVPV